MQDNYGKIFDRYVRYSNEKQGLEYFHNNPDAPQQELNHNDNAAISTGMGLFDLSADESGDDPEEEAFRRRMQLQQKKKKRRGIRM